MTIYIHYAVKHVLSPIKKARLISGAGFFSLCDSISYIVSVESQVKARPHAFAVILAAALVFFTYFALTWFIFIYLFRSIYALDIIS